MSTNNYTTAPQSSVNGLAAKIVLQNPDGTVGSSGLPYGADYAGYTLNGDGNPTVIVFKKGGSGGTTLKTRTIAYTGTNVTSITDA